jgi:hypothetical protein
VAAEVVVAATTLKQTVAAVALLHNKHFNLNLIENLRLEVLPSQLVVLVMLVKITNPMPKVVVVVADLLAVAEAVTLVILPIQVVEAVEAALQVSMMLVH